MKENIPEELPEKAYSALRTFVVDERLSKSQVRKTTLQAEIFIKKFRALRSKMRAKAQAQSLFTDEDIFDKIS